MFYKKQCTGNKILFYIKFNSKNRDLSVVQILKKQQQAYYFN